MIYIKNDRPVGIIVDIAEALGIRLNHPFKIVAMNWARAQEIVLEGKAGALLQINRTEERDKIFDFSDTLLHSEFSIFITADRVGISSIRDLKGLKVGLEEKGFPIQLLKKDTSIKIKTISDFINGFNLLKSGVVDAVVVDKWVGLFVLSEKKIRGIKIADEPIEISKSRIAVKKGNTRLLNKINKALAHMKSDGTYSRILNKWQHTEVIFQTKDEYRKQKKYMLTILFAFLTTFFVVFILIYEIKKRKRFEKKLIAQNKKYEILNKELIKSNQALIDSEIRLKNEKRISEKASKAKSEFLANMSHEIRTPLNAIIGLVHLILNESLSSKHKDYMRKIDASSKLLLRIINDILDYSKIEAGYLELEEKIFSLNKVILRVKELFSIKASVKDLKLIFEVSPDIPDNIIGDSLRLEQVLNNLISNAIKFTYQGEIKVTICAVETNKDTSLMEISVRDTGIGISDDHLKNLFHSFSQADGSTTRKFGGTGLGLSISKKLVELMGGKIDVTSKEGCGSTFTFTVRFSLAHEHVGANVEYRQKDKKSMSKSDTSHQFGKRYFEKSRPIRGARILLVEDNELNAIVTKDILEKMGLNVKVASNGRVGVDMVTKSKYDAVLMDLQMPEMDGFEATKQIRAAKQGNELPIIAMTAAAMVQDKQTCLKAGMNDHIAKPFKPDKLIDLLLKWIKRSDSNDFECHNLHESKDPGVSFELPGFEFKHAIKRMMGDWNKLKRLLINFENQFKDTEKELNNLIDNKDYSKANGIIHSIKGASGTIGAHRLFEASQTLEKELKSGKAISLEQFFQPFEYALQSIRTHIKEGDSTPSQVDFNISFVKESLKQLTNILKENKLVPEKLISDLRSQISGTHSHALFKQLETQIDSFDYDSGLQTILDIIKSINTSSMKDLKRA